MKSKLTLLLSLAFLFLFSGFVCGDDFKGGAEAYQRKDYKEAVRLYRLSAEQGDARAQIFLGLMYYKGQGVPQDYKEAVKWFRLSAEQGEASAQYNLGQSYYQGKGVPQDYKEAVKWFRLLAEQGFAKAQPNLGGMYYQGKGVLQDYALAHMWFNLCGSSGNDNCVKIRNEIEKKMTPSQIEKAQEMAREWMERDRESKIRSKEKPVEESKSAKHKEPELKTPKELSSEKKTTYLFVCNDAEYYDKASKKGPMEVMASASVTILVDQKKAELLLGSKTNSLINTRANHDMDLTVELTDGEYVFTGVEDTGNSKTDTFFSYYADKRELLASYADVVVKFKECVDMGNEVSSLPKGDMPDDKGSVIINTGKELDHNKEIDGGFGYSFNMLYQDIGNIKSEHGIKVVDDGKGKVEIINSKAVTAVIEQKRDPKKFKDLLLKGNVRLHFSMKTGKLIRISGGRLFIDTRFVSDFSDSPKAQEIYKIYDDKITSCSETFSELTKKIKSRYPSILEYTPQRVMIAKSGELYKGFAYKIETTEMSRKYGASKPLGRNIDIICQRIRSSSHKLLAIDFWATDHQDPIQLNLLK
jgi:TPR repeat protein